MVENLHSQKYELERPDKGEKYKYHMIKHSHEKSNPKNRDRLDMLKHWKKNAFEDGLNVSQALSASAVSASRFYICIHKYLRI